MKKDRKLQKLVNRLVEMSFDMHGRVIEENVRRFTRTLRLLPSSQAALALSGYLEGLKRNIKQTTLEIETTLPLSLAQVKKVASLLRTKHQVTDIKNSVDPNILGGMRIRIGDMVYDDTITRKIAQVREAIES